MYHIAPEFCSNPFRSLFRRVPQVAGACVLGLSFTLGGCHDSADDEVPVVVVGDGNSGQVRYLDTQTYDAHRVYFYQDIAGKIEPETVSVWAFPNESSLLVSEHQLDAYSKDISIYTRVVVFDGYTSENEMMAWLDDDLAGYHNRIQPQSVTWIDYAVGVDSLTYQDTHAYGNEFVDEYEVHYHIDGVSVPGEFVLYALDDYEEVLAMHDQ